MGIVETVRGINTLPDILRQVTGIGAIWAGPGDLSVSMGLRGHATHPDVEAGVQQILSICQNAGVPCATGITPAASVDTRLEQGFRLGITPPTRSLGTLHRGRQAAGRRD
jgi:2-keto-3-deoxy-L-rhamnonate aldolase RhmA